MLSLKAIHEPVYEILVLIVNELTLIKPTSLDKQNF